MTAHAAGHRRGRRHAQTAGIDTARVDAEYLAAHTAGVDRGRLTWHEPDEAFFDRYHELVTARARRIPLQHLTTTAAFGPVTLDRRARRVHPATGD